MIDAITLSAHFEDAGLRRKQADALAAAVEQAIDGVGDAVADRIMNDLLSSLGDLSVQVQSLREEGSRSISSSLQTWTLLGILAAEVAILFKLWP